MFRRLQQLDGLSIASVIAFTAYLAAVILFQALPSDNEPAEIATAQEIRAAQ